MVAPNSAHTASKRDGPFRLFAPILPGDVDGALKELGETFDIDREDLNELMQLAESKALARRLSTT